ncbi:hypothetical protein EC973_005173 [Apophysomyces ossiformis]|uniref:SH3 domain-containing protein n=1 Tax=Apophysomyces ossiformis TaxID=679940 RepID=A0A8H7BXY8_9FUNG|nr:hypothetical protein EC973_005173 [Apophysomyces ossiformis]
MSKFTINSPLPSSLASECKKAATILNSFINPGHGVDKIIPPDILADAKGIAVITVLKAGFLFSARAGSGLVVGRLPDGVERSIGYYDSRNGFWWPSAELTDFVMILNTWAAVKTFMHHGTLTLGGNISVAAGPVGRNAEVSGSASYKNMAAVYSYSKTKGLFAGVSLEGSVIVERFDANAKLYGGKVSAKDLLNGNIPRPPQADVLYQALNMKFHRPNDRFSFMNGGRSHDFNDHRHAYHTSSGLDNRSDQQFSFSRGAIRNQVSGLGSTGALNNSSTVNASRYTDSGFGGVAYDNVDVVARETLASKEQDTTISREPKARALFNFPGEQDGDLPFRKGDIILVTKKSNTQNDWWTGKIGSSQGIFPANFVELL